MLYSAFQAWSEMMLAPRWAATAALQWRDTCLGTLGDEAFPRRIFALLDVFEGAKVTHVRPPYEIESVLCGNSLEPVREEVVADLPFCELLHFAKDGVQAPQPKLLVVAPLSGHFATLLRSTVQTLLRDHDVYITDWKNARDVPMTEGRFGLDDYTDYVIRFLQQLGPGSNVLAVCQPCVPTLAAVALMAQDKDPAQPRTMTLMGGPVDTRVAPTVVNKLANEKPLEWFEDSLISEVPWAHAGAGRRVYPGFLQLTAFVTMNLERHFEQHRKLYQLLADGDAVRHSDQVGVFEFHAGTLVTIVEQNVQATSSAFRVEVIGRLLLRGVLVVGRRDHDVEGRDRLRQGHAVLVVEEFDGAAQNALDAYSVRAHDRRDFLAVGIQDTQAHGLRIFVSKLEDVTDLDRLYDLQRCAALRAGISRGHLAKVAEFRLEVLAGRDVAQVVVVTICA